MAKEGIDTKSIVDGISEGIGKATKVVGDVAGDVGGKVVKKASDIKKALPDQVLTQEGMMQLLDECYAKSLDGIPKVSPSIEEVANEYLKRYDSPNEAAKAMIKNQVYKCTTSGFITGFGGFIVMPVTIPANVGSVLYVQMRMIACTAHMAGFNLEDDHVQTLVYACLAGVAVNDIIKVTSAKFGIKFVEGLIKKIPGKTLTKINQKVGFRFITKFGEKGLVNLGKLLPGVGAVIGGGMDYVETKTIGNRSYKWFFENDFSVKDRKDISESDDIIDYEIIDKPKSGEEND